MAKLAESIGDGLQITDDTKKSAAQLRAERREKQEADRAIKAAANPVKPPSAANPAESIAKKSEAVGVKLDSVNTEHHLPIHPTFECLASINFCNNDQDADHECEQLAEAIIDVSVYSVCHRIPANCSSSARTRNGSAPAPTWPSSKTHSCSSSVACAKDRM